MAEFLSLNVTSARKLIQTSSGDGGSGGDHEEGRSDRLGVVNGSGAAAARGKQQARPRKVGDDGGCYWQRGHSSR